MKVCPKCLMGNEDDLKQCRSCGQDLSTYLKIAGHGPHQHCSNQEPSEYSSWPAGEEEEEEEEEKEACIPLWQKLPLNETEKFTPNLGLFLLIFVIAALYLVGISISNESDKPNTGASSQTAIIQIPMQQLEGYGFQPVEIIPRQEIDNNGGPPTQGLQPTQNMPGIYQEQVPQMPTTSAEQAMWSLASDSERVKLLSKGAAEQGPKLPPTVTAQDMPASIASTPPRITVFPILPYSAENGDIRNMDNDFDGRREPVHVKGYYRKDGTYVRGHYRARPRR